MARTAPRIPGIDRVDLPEVRQAIPYLHAYLRDCVLDGRLPPGTTLSQVALADQLGVSRTPLREVLRMLQEEGFVESEPNQRMRVAGFDAAELDSDYACRITLETLALSMTIDSLGEKERRQGAKILATMRRAARTGDFPAWFAAHHQYHRTMTVGAPQPLLRQLKSLEDRSVRYIRIYQQSEPSGWQSAGEGEHAAILEALTAGDDRAALAGLANHLARTALRVMADCAPDYRPTAVPHAVALATGTSVAPAAQAPAS
ncbi:GntR family transcriptional regulator [Kineosporia sp. A_224]|uniref:GntR family transcriptional regulator n=1 Tax=Kineosporia sp. A_224 TaxID=1962180 RepID=UPI000B4BB496|nr:GntR family transcriptional regulator [Kineosporia sp. A_224]